MNTRGHQLGHLYTCTRLWLVKPTCPIRSSAKRLLLLVCILGLWSVLPAAVSRGRSSLVPQCLHIPFSKAFHLRCVIALCSHVWPKRRGVETRVAMLLRALVLGPITQSSKVGSSQTDWVEEEGANGYISRKEGFTRGNWNCAIYFPVFSWLGCWTGLLWMLNAGSSQTVTSRRLAWGIKRKLSAPLWTGE